MTGWFGRMTGWFGGMRGRFWPDGQNDGVVWENDELGVC